MNSVLRVNRWLVSCKCIDALFHMLLSLAGLALTLFMQWAPATYASTGAIFQRVGDIALAPLKNSFLIEDAALNKTLFEWALNLPASPLSGGSGGGGDGNNQIYDGSEPEPLNVVSGEEIWLAQVSAERLLSKTLKNKRRLLRIAHKKLQRAIAEGNSELVKILGDRIGLIEVELDELERSGQPLSPVVLLWIKAAFTSDQLELQDYDDRFLRRALSEHPVTMNVDPDSLIIRPDKMSRQQMRLYLQWLYSAAGLLYSELKQRLLRQLRQPASYSESHLVAIDSLLTELDTCVRQFRSMVITDSSTQRIGRQVPNSDTQTGHSEKPSASQTFSGQPSTSRQASISGSGFGERRFARCPDGGDGSNGHPFFNWHTRNNHCPTCNNGPCVQRVNDNSPANNRQLPFRGQEPGGSQTPQLLAVSNPDMMNIDAHNGRGNVPQANINGHSVVIIRREFQKIMDNIQRGECAICFSGLEISFANPTTLLNCTHAFHKNCIEKAFTTQKKCPICRGESELPPSLTSTRDLESLKARLPANVGCTNDGCLISSLKQAEATECPHPASQCKHLLSGHGFQAGRYMQHNSDALKQWVGSVFEKNGYVGSIDYLQNPSGIENHPGEPAILVNIDFGSDNGHQQLFYSSADINKGQTAEACFNRLLTDIRIDLMMLSLRKNHPSLFEKASGLYITGWNNHKNEIYTNKSVRPLSLTNTLDLEQQVVKWDGLKSELQRAGLDPNKLYHGKPAPKLTSPIHFSLPATCYVIDQAGREFIMDLSKFWKLVDAAVAPLPKGKEKLTSII